MGRAGFEPATHGFSIRSHDGVKGESEKTYDSYHTRLTDQLTDGGAATDEIDPELARIVAAWATLPTATRVRIMAMIDASGSNCLFTQI